MSSKGMLPPICCQRFLHSGLNSNILGGQRNSGWKVNKCHLLKTATPWTSRPAASLAIFHGARTASILSKQISAKNCFLRSPKQLIVPEVPCPLTRLEVWDCQWILRKQDPVWAPCLSDSNALDKSKTILTKRKNCVIVNHVNTKCSLPVSSCFKYQRKKHTMDDRICQIEWKILRTRQQMWY